MKELESYDITPFIIKCDEEVRNEIISLTDEDYFLMKSNIPSLRDMCQDLQKRRRPIRRSNIDEDLLEGPPEEPEEIIEL